MIRVNVLYAAPPDGDDASAAYASRASSFFTKQPPGNPAIHLGHIGPLIADEDRLGGDGVPWRTAPSEGDADEADGDDARAAASLTLFLISCAADGAVHRSVRQLTRRLNSASSTEDAASTLAAKAEEATTATAASGIRYYVLAALGHARCANSATQMADAIFGAGRRFDKALVGSGVVESVCPRLETQVELCGPEAQFDPWLELLLGKLKQHYSE